MASLQSMEKGAVVCPVCDQTEEQNYLPTFGSRHHSKEHSHVLGLEAAQAEIHGHKATKDVAVEH